MSKLFILSGLLICICVPMAAESLLANPDSTYLARIRERQDQNWSGNLGIFGGINKLLADEWSGAQFQPNVGVMFDIGKRGWLANIAIDYKFSSEEGTFRGQNVEGELTELDIGARFHIDDPTINWKSYFGAGIAFIEDELSIDGVSDSGSETGFWLNAGLYYRWQNQWNIGVDLRYSAVIDDIEDNKLLTPDHYAYGLMVGYHW